MEVHLMVLFGLLMSLCLGVPIPRSEIRLKQTPRGGHQNNPSRHQSGHNVNEERRTRHPPGLTKRLEEPSQVNQTRQRPKLIQPITQNENATVNQNINPVINDNVHPEEAIIQNITTGINSSRNSTDTSRSASDMLIDSLSEEHNMSVTKETGISSINGSFIEGDDENVTVDQNINPVIKDNVQPDETMTQNYTTDIDSSRNSTDAFNISVHEARNASGTPIDSLSEEHNISVTKETGNSSVNGYFIERVGNLSGNASVTINDPILEDTITESDSSPATVDTESTISRSYTHEGVAEIVNQTPDIEDGVKASTNQSTTEDLFKESSNQTVDFGGSSGDFSGSSSDFSGSSGDVSGSSGDLSGSSGEFSGSSGDFSGCSTSGEFHESSGELSGSSGESSGTSFVSNTILGKSSAVEATGRSRESNGSFNETSEKSIQTHESSKSSGPSSVKHNGESGESSVPSTIKPVESNVSSGPSSIKPGESSESSVPSTIKPVESNVSSGPSSIKPGESSESSVPSTVKPVESNVSSGLSSIKPGESIEKFAELSGIINNTNSTTNGNATSIM